MSNLAANNKRYPQGLVGVTMPPPSKKAKTAHTTAEDKSGILSWALSNPSIIRINVGRGQDRKSFYVNEKLACHYSKYFDTMLNGQFAEAKNKQVDWEDEEADTVKLFVAWLYSLELDLENTSVIYSTAQNGHVKRETGQGVSADGKTPKSLLLFKLWVLADKRNSPMLANAAITAYWNLTSTSESMPDSKDILWLFNNTSANSKMRAIVIERVARSTELSTFNPTGMRLPQDFSDLVIRRIGGVFKHYTHQVHTLDVCQYHFHDAGDNCKGHTT